MFRFEIPPRREPPPPPPPSVGALLTLMMEDRQATRAENAATSAELQTDRAPTTAIFKEEKFMKTLTTTDQNP